MIVKPNSHEALLGFDMVLPWRVRSQAGHPINEIIFYLCIWGRDNLPRHPSLIRPEVSVASCFLCVCFGVLIDGLT